MYDFAALYQKKSTRALELRSFPSIGSSFCIHRKSVADLISFVAKVRRFARVKVDLREMCGFAGFAGGRDGEDGELCFFIDPTFFIFLGEKFKYVRRSICFRADGTV